MTEITLISTGIHNLDRVLGGGLPIYSLNLIAGPPGTGKTILVQQFLFNYIEANPEATVLYLTTLSEPMLKVVRYMQQFSFFDGELFGERVIYADIGSFIVERPIEQLPEHLMQLINQYNPAIVAIDSFKAIHDLTPDSAQFRRFCYTLSIQFASARCTTLLISESSREDLIKGAEFAIADGILYLDLQWNQGEQQRSLQVRKLRGQSSAMESFPFVITQDGIQLFAPNLTLRQPYGDLAIAETRIKIGIPGFDDLLPQGILLGRSLILSGMSGTGKSTLALQFLIEGAKRGERGLLVAVEETSERLHRMATSYGWNLAALEAQGLLRIIAIPQSDIRVEQQIEQMIQLAEEFQPQRFVLDSLSVFLFKIIDPVLQRERAFQITTLVHHVGAVGLLITDVPADRPDMLSRHGVEETVADGTILLSTQMFDQGGIGQRRQRQRYLEIYKMRSTQHVTGRHRMAITAQGIEIFYLPSLLPAPVAASSGGRVLTFAPLQDLIQGSLNYSAAWLIQGEPGVGKSTLAHQFAIEGLKRRESVLYLSADAPKEQVQQSLQALNFLPDPYLESGQLVILDAFTPGQMQLDLNDPEALLYVIVSQLQQMPRPCRKIFDSLAPLSVGLSHNEFVSLVYQKNRLQHQRDVVLFDVFPRHMLDDTASDNLLNAYDVVLDLYTPDWGEMNQQGNIGYRTLKVRKVRGATADTRPYPYTLSPGEGIVLQKSYYQWGAK